MVDYSIKRYGEYSDDELVERLQLYARKMGVSFVSSRSFTQATGVSEATMCRHFGSWKEACRRAGLAPRYDRTSNRDDLFDNLDRVWQTLGRQPRAKEMTQPLSPISISRYQKVLAKPWYDICVEYLAHKSGVSVVEIDRETRPPVPKANSRGGRVAQRGVSLSLRYEVLKRDNFRCVKCGRSPATGIGVQLHVDHAISWANGGDTVLANLQTLCSDCNLGKSNKHDG
jgi:hypothetical protein